MADSLPSLTEEEIEDLEDAPDSEQEEVTEEVVDQATAASTIAELKLEIITLVRLEGLAASVRRSGQDTKWRELSSLLSQLFGSALIADAPFGSPAAEGPHSSATTVAYTEARPLHRAP